MTPFAVRSLADLLERATGQQLLPGRHWRIETVLKPVMRDHGFATLYTLAGAVSADLEGPLAQEVVEALLNHETCFFRDPEPFRLLLRDGLDRVCERRQEKRALRLWSAGCATGQELYSVAMAIGVEGVRWSGWDVGLTGTDISHRAITRASEGVYTHFEVQRGLPITSLVRSFDPEGERWRIKAEHRRKARFFQHNLLDPPPGERFDVILCRNVLLYFAPARQRQVLARLREALAPDGLLMLGAGETVLDSSEDFRADPALKGFYRAAA